MFKILRTGLLSLLILFINGQTIENCNKIGVMENSVNNLHLYSMGVYVCLEPPKNLQKILNINNLSKINYHMEKDGHKILSNLTNSTSKNITHFNNNSSVVSNYTEPNDINIISPSPIKNDISPSPFLSTQPSPTQQEQPKFSNDEDFGSFEKNDISPSSSLKLYPSANHNKKINNIYVIISIITLSSILVSFTVSYICYRRKCCVRLNKTEPVSEITKKKRVPDIENGEKLTRHPTFLNIKKNKKLYIPRFNLHKKILDIKDNPNNNNSPKMIIRERQPSNIKHQESSVSNT